jgi:hypothetical protein
MLPPGGLPGFGNERNVVKPDRPGVGFAPPFLGLQSVGDAGDQHAATTIMSPLRSRAERRFESQGVREYESEEKRKRAFDAKLFCFTPFLMTDHSRERMNNNYYGNRKLPAPLLRPYRDWFTLCHHRRRAGDSYNPAGGGGELRRLCRGCD